MEYYELFEILVMNGKQNHIKIFIRQTSLTNI